MYFAVTFQSAKQGVAIFSISVVNRHLDPDLDLHRSGNSDSDRHLNDADYITLILTMATTYLLCTLKCNSKVHKRLKEIFHRELSFFLFQAPASFS